MTANPQLRQYAGRWAFDAENSSIGFAVRHQLVARVSGPFRRFRGVIDRDEKGAATVAVGIEADSLDTGNTKRDEHLRWADYFDVARFPTAAFHSGEIRPTSISYAVAGDLTLKGVTRRVDVLADFA